MLRGQSRPVVSQLYSLIGAAPCEKSDGQLLEQFLVGRDEAAFTVLLRRHGGMVLRVCRRVLHQPQDAEDAFQATFLLLARNARAIRKAESVASWLYGVAYRLAIKARTQAARRQAREKQAVHMRAKDSGAAAAWQELQVVLDEELHRLPPKYQAPLVLCYLEGKTHEEAAAQLGWPLGTVRGRVARAREALHRRLARRGLTLPAAALATALAADIARAVPARLLGTTCKGALAHVAGGSIPTGLVTAKAAALAEGGVMTMTTTPVKFGLILCLVIGVASAGAGAFAARRGGEDPVAAFQKKKRPREQPAAPVELPVGTQAAGSVARLGNAMFWPGTLNSTGYTLTFTADSKQVAVVGANQAIYVWDVPTGRLAARVGGVDRPGITIQGITFSPDGKLVAATENGTGIRVWDVKGNREVAHLTGVRAGKLSSCRFAPDGKTLAAGAGDGVVHRWQVADWKELASCEGHKGQVNAVVWSPDATMLVSAGDDQMVRVWDAAGKLMRTLIGHRDRVIGVAAAPDGKTLASRGADNTLRVWDAETGKELRWWETVQIGGWAPGMESAWYVTFTPDGKKLIIGTFAGNQTYDAATGELLPGIGANPGAGGPVVVSPDGKWMASGGFRKAIRVWNAVSGKDVVTPIGHLGPVMAAAYSPDGKTLVTGGVDRTVRLWDVATGRELRQFRGHTGTVAQLHFSRDGRHLFTASSDQNDRNVSCWDMASGNQERQFPGHPWGVATMGLTPDGKELRVIDRTGLLHVWDIATGKETTPSALHTPFNPLFAPDGKTLVYQGGAPAVLHMLDTSKDGTDRVLEGPDPGGIARVAMSADGRLLLSVAFNQSLHLWDPVAGKLMRRLRAGPAQPLYVTTIPAAPVFSPDNRTVAVPSHDAVALVEVATARDRLVFRGGQGTITAVAFAPDGATLVTGGEDGTTLIWDVRQAAAASGELAAKDLDAAWADLAGEDATKAYKTMRALAAAARQAVPFFRTQVKAPPTATQDRIAKLIADLGSAEFKVRKNAEAALSKLGIVARTAMEKALAAKPSLDVTQRLEKLLQALEDQTLSPEDVQRVRAVEVLERIGNDEARRLLQDWAKGTAGPLLMDEAKASLARLEAGVR
jgi:RNA polymerase sigma factor (sigma-70 family)